MWLASGRNTRTPMPALQGMDSRRGPPIPTGYGYGSDSTVVTSGVRRRDGSTHMAPGCTVLDELYDLHLAE